MRKISIITLISLFFALTMVVINIALALEYKRQKSDLEYFAFQRFMMSVKIINDRPLEEQEGQLKTLHVKISSYEKERVKNDGIFLLEDPFFEMVRYEEKLFFVPKSLHKRHPFPPPPPSGFGMMEHRPPPMMKLDVMFEDCGEFSMARLWILAFLINLFLIIFFSVVMRKILRLRELKSAIRSFGEEAHVRSIEVKSEDELGEIATEFNHAMQKIHRLKEARTLFLRNILHELKTPIMKGKILATCKDEEGHKEEQLIRVFDRLEHLLGEMVKIEKLASNEWTLSRKEYRLVDVIDHAMDLLMCDTSRIHLLGSANAPTIWVDFDLFTTAVKNLLENALKYSYAEIEVGIFGESVTVCSQGEPLSKEQKDFTKVFNRSIEGASHGLGLGLYITHAIVEKHHFRLVYEHVEGANCFTIYFNER